VLAKNEIPTLANIVIIDQMHVDLHNPSFCTIQGFVASGIAQAKEMSYHNQHPIDKFLPLTIDVFGCLFKQANVFLHNCANVIWSFKGPKGQRALPFLFRLLLFVKEFQLRRKGCKHLPF